MLDDIRYIRKQGQEMTIKELKHEIGSLALADAQKLNEWLQDRLKVLKREEKEKVKQSKRKVLKEERRGSWLYQQIAVKCGKPTCKCNEGEPHGTYWYGYRREKGKMVSKYIGKVFKELPN
jgi:hypothetical protein